jgi:hypothetical protein
METEGSTTGDAAPETNYDDAPAGDDALAHTDSSTEHEAGREAQEASRSDVDAATQRDRVEEGRLHARDEADRSETGGA